MRLLDLVKLVFENLGRRKARVALTAVGVVIGTAAVIVLVSLGVGLQRNATEQLGGIGELTRIDVMPTYGEGPYGGEGGVVMVGGGGGGGGGGSGTSTGTHLITDQALAELAALPGVSGVYPRDYFQGGGMLNLGRLESYPSFIGVPPDYLTDFGYEMQAGTLSLERGTAVVGAMVAQNFYDPRPRPGDQIPAPPELYDQTLRLTLIRWNQDGTETRRTLPLRIVGVIAETRGEPDYSLYISLEELTSFNQWFSGRRIDRNRDGYPSAVVRVADSTKVLEVADMITATGLQAYTPQQFIQGINSFFVVLQVVFGGVGAIALLVAAIGIANTMTMAILERTREIGLMKAVGATNRDVLAIFLGEAGGIGLVGGLGGVALGWSAGQVINVLALAYLAGQAAQTGGLPPSVAVFTPSWLPVSALVFATFIGLISGLYPALRAATLVPVTALKYE
jgi:putative ABC transport system permease protein